MQLPFQFYVDIALLLAYYARRKPRNGEKLGVRVNARQFLPNDRTAKAKEARSEKIDTFAPRRAYYS